jgi:hypothetical protein
MKPFARTIAAILFIPALLVGCTPRPYDTDSSLGLAVHDNLSAQIVNANGIPPTGPQGLYGSPAKAVMDRYVSSFLAPPPPANPFTIGIGTGTSSSMAAPVISGTTP